MLKIRVASAFVGVALLFLVVWSGQIVLGMSIFLLSILALNEFYSAVANIGYKPVRFVGYISSVPVLFLSISGFFDKLSIFFDFLGPVNSVLLGVFLILMVLFCLIIFLHNKYNIFDISITVFGILYIVFLFSFIVLIRNTVNGFYYVWLIFIGAFATDTFAYFSGRLFGKHKLMPAISPKKTVEGSLGGVAGCAVAMMLYGFYLDYGNMVSGISLYHYVIMGLLCGIISQVGDWSASAIKRFVKVKDYGNIMPGHGGVLDRFDSILFTAPVIYFYLHVMIRVA